MRVFLSGTSLDPAYGGPAYSVSRLATALAEAGVDVGLWSPDGSALATDLVPRDSRVERLGGSAREALGRFGRADVIHDNGLWRSHNHRLRVVAASRRIPRIVSTRGMLEPWALEHKRLKKRIAWWAYQRRDLMKAAAIHATSAPELENLLSHSLGVPLRFIPNGVDLPAAGVLRHSGAVASGAHPDEVHERVLTALFVGRIYPVKGLPMLIEAWARVRPRGWRLQIVGPDESGHRAEVERRVTAAGLESEISFTGPLTGADKEAAFTNADLFVLPTHSESFGMAIAEALSHGLPVLTTTAAPWPALEDRTCGWRVEATVDGLARGLAKVVALSPETLRAMGLAGHEFVAFRLRWERIAKQFCELYEEAIDGAG